MPEYKLGNATYVLLSSLFFVFKNLVIMQTVRLTPQINILDYKFLDNIKLRELTSEDGITG